MKLKTAIELYKEEIGSISNSYDWYRKCAVRTGFITIGEFNIETIKVKGIWYIDEIDFEESIKSHRLIQQKIKQNTVDYNNNIIHSINDKIQTDFGHYINFGDFRLVVSLSDIYKYKNNGVWFCNTCNKVAQMEYEKEECHLCSDWTGCGEDCTLSLIFCNKCKTELER